MLLLTFNAGPNRYAIDVMWVLELVPRVELRSVPHAPPHLSGLLGYRGSVVPVVDLGILLGSEACRDRLSTRIILVRKPLASSGHDPETSGLKPLSSTASTNHTVLGLMADHVSELAYVQPEDLLPAPVHLAGAPYLANVVRTERGIVQMVDIMKLTAAIDF